MNPGGPTEHGPETRATSTAWRPTTPTPTRQSRPISWAKLSFITGRHPGLRSRGGPFSRLHGPMADANFAGPSPGAFRQTYRRETTAADEEGR
ncbi:ORF 3 [Haloarcula hispanica virus SH1]|uniref:ORF 3 n=1 Tax=Haloarcula hispanica SH1 virus TaxID=326574 RepID=Q4KPI4_9VIRU|nr:ORF 3 [Haloarcula hispanica virus SH1]AAY24929.1 ORF 3 [Haloarcula hispanica virus SH1]